MRKFTVLMMLLSANLFAQYSPPTEEASTPKTASVSYDAQSGKFISPKNWAKANDIVTSSGGVLKSLTPGKGLSGQPFNGTTPLTWSLNIGEGLMFDSDILEVDKNFIREIAGAGTATEIQGFQILVDTTPSVNPGDAVTTQTVKLNINIPYFYYKENPDDPLPTLEAARSVNGAPYQTSYTASVDVPKNTYWTDCEFKVLDKNKNLVYWVSTQRGAQFQSSDYATNPATDLNAKIYYTLADTHDPDNRNWVLFEYNSTDARSIYEHAQKVSGNPTPTIGGIVIQPNFKGATVGGSEIKDIFESPGNSYVFLRCSPSTIEKTKGGDAIWRPTSPMPLSQKQTEEN